MKNIIDINEVAESLKKTIQETQTNTENMLIKKEKLEEDLNEINTKLALLNAVQAQLEDNKKEIMKQLEEINKYSGKINIKEVKKIEEPIKKEIVQEEKPESIKHPIKKQPRRRIKKLF